MNGTCIKKKFIGCKNTSVYYIRFFQEKSPKNELKKSNR